MFSEKLTEMTHFHSTYSLLKNQLNKPVELKLEIKIRRLVSHFYSNLLDEIQNELVFKGHPLYKLNYGITQIWNRWLFYLTIALHILSSSNVCFPQAERPILPSVQTVPFPRTHWDKPLVYSESFVCIIYKKAPHIQVFLPCRKVAPCQQLWKQRKIDKPEHLMSSNYLLMIVVPMPVWQPQSLIKHLR